MANRIVVSGQWSVVSGQPVHDLWEVASFAGGIPPLAPERSSVG
jgi:hypothetical protein